MGCHLKGRLSEDYKDPTWLREKYTEGELSRKEIGDICGVNENTIRYFMKKYGIPSRTGRDRATSRLREKWSEERKGFPTWNTGLAGKYEKWTKRGQEAPGYKGGVAHNASGGYRKVLVADHPCADKNGYVFEHRLVCEVALKRYLTPNEIVHHRDGNRKNNTPSNLFVFSSNSQHIKFHHAKRKNGFLTEEEFCDKAGYSYSNLRQN